MIAQSQVQKDSVLTVIKINEVTISAAKSSKSLEGLPLPTSVISEKEIIKSGASKLDELITKETGIVSVATKTGTEGLQMQGLDASYITILLDGSPIIGRSFGALDLNRISVGAIEKIEIIRGASSSLYGSNALGGVVNLVSKKQYEDGKKIMLGLKSSSNNTINPNIIYQYKKARFQISNFMDYYKTDGYDLIKTDLLKTVNPFTNYTLSSKIRYQFSDKLMLKTQVKYYNQEQLFTSEKSSDLFEGESIVKEKNFTSSLKYLINSNFSQEAEIYWTNYRTDEFLLDSVNLIFDENFYDHSLLHSELKTNFTYLGVNGIVGFGMTKEELARKDFSNKSEQDLQFFYGQLETKVFGVVDVIAGSRHDNYKNYSPEISNKLALGIPLSAKMRINGSVGTGFKIPDFRQRYFDFTNSTIGYTVLGRDVAFDRLTDMQNNGILESISIPFAEIQTPLKSETSLNINVGVKYKPTKNFSFGINLFNNKVNDLIDWQLVANTTSSTKIYSYFNINQVVTEGIELNTVFSPTSKLQIKMGYQLLYAYDTEVKNRLQKEKIYARDPETQASVELTIFDYFGLFNRSRHMGNFKLFYDINDKLDVNTIITYRSKYAINDSNGNNLLDTYDEFIKGYALCDLGITHHTTSLSSIQLGIKNIFGFTNPEYISNISGRLYYFNIKININN